MAGEAMPDLGFQATTVTVSVVLTVAAEMLVVVAMAAVR